MFSLGKLIWLIVIILVVWYVFKIIEKKNKNKKAKENPKNLEAFKCPFCGLWTSENNCSDKNCRGNK